MIAALVCGQPDGKYFPGRCTVPIMSRPMMAYPLLAAKHCSDVDEVYLSTDAESVARIGTYYGARVLERPTALRGQEVPLESIVSHGGRTIASQHADSLEALVVLLCNAPTVTSDLISTAIDLLRSGPEYDAAVSASRRNEFHPSMALRLNADQTLEPWLDDAVDEPDAFFADALVWVLRPSRYLEEDPPTPRWLTNFRGRGVVPLIHEGYGDVDYPWQVGLVESWLRRQGFTAESTPYSDEAREQAEAVTAMPAVVPASAVEKRVLITTVPFGEPEPLPLQLLKSNDVEFVINPIGRRLTEGELAELAADFGVLIAGTEPITAAVMDAGPHLRLISRVGIGLDNVDLLAARRRDIAVSYTPDAPSPAVAELTLALVLDLLRRVSLTDHHMRNGVWQRVLGRRMEGLTVGLIGVGRVGKRVIRLIRGAFPEARILANDLVPDLAFGDTQQVVWMDKESIYKEADVISLHLPLTPQTKRLVTAAEMELMKPSVLLINTARGGLIAERDLADALRLKRIAGAAIDVFEHEPYSGELATIENCLLTCHMGSMTEDCRARMELEATEEAIRYLKGDPLRQLVPEMEYAMLSSI